MDLLWIIYFIDVLAGSPMPIFSVILGISIIPPVLAGLKAMSVEGNTSDTENYVNFVNGYKEAITSRIAKIAIAYLIIASTINFLVPSKDTAYKMLAAYGVTEIAKNDDVQRLSGKSLEVLEKAMDKYLVEENKN